MRHTTLTELLWQTCFAEIVNKPLADCGVGVACSGTPFTDRILRIDSQDFSNFGACLLRPVQIDVNDRQMSPRWNEVRNDGEDFVHQLDSLFLTA